MIGNGRTAQGNYAWGKELAEEALKDKEGGLKCAKLELAIASAAYWKEDWVRHMLPARIRWWKGIIQKHWVRPGDDAYERYADTDFLDHY